MVKLTKSFLGNDVFPFYEFIFDCFLRVRGFPHWLLSVSKSRTPLLQELSGGEGRLFFMNFTSICPSFNSSREFRDCRESDQPRLCVRKDNYYYNFKQLHYTIYSSTEYTYLHSLHQYNIFLIRLLSSPPTLHHTART